MEFSHLHNHSEFSLLDGLARPAELCAIAVSQGQKHIALTDHGNIHGLYVFEREAQKAGISPVRGCELYITNGIATSEISEGQRQTNDNYHLTALVETITGYRNMLTLTSRAALENFYYVPRVKKDWLRQYGEGLYILSGCVGGEISQAILSASYDDDGRDGDRQRKKTGIQLGEIEKAEEIFRWYAETFRGHFAVEIMDHGLAIEQHCHDYLIPWARKYDLPLVATNDCHVCRESDRRTQNVVIAINTRSTVDSDGLSGSEGNWIKTAEEMAQIPVIQSLLNSGNAREGKVLRQSIEIAERCTFDVKRGENLLPDFPLPPGEKNLVSYMKKLLGKAIEKKYPAAIGNREHPVWARVGYELGVIEPMGFLSYFLIVADMIDWARKQGIVVGPGRGSAAGSIIAYLLNITTVDPLEYGLLFERFLNPSRISMPDVDIDFESSHRADVVQYVKQKYGPDHVGHVATFGTFQALNAPFEVARSLGFDVGESRRFASVIPPGFPELGSKSEEYDLSQVEEYTNQDERWVEAYNISRNLQGRTRNVGTHPSAIVISKDPIVVHAPMMPTRTGGDGIPQIQWDMHDAEDIFLKMDFLSIETLDLLSRCQDELRLIYGPEWELEHIPLNDPETLSMLSRGGTFGVFQLDKSTASRVTEQVKPDNFNDVISINALSRPGPLDYVPTFVARKRGEEAVTYVHPDVEPILSGTYGLPLFQDQVMLMARVLAGYSLGEADSLRKAMGKKLPAEMAKHRSRFVEGCLDKGIGNEVSIPLFEDLAKFSGYGFNRAHSACYSKIGMWTAWIRCHHLELFYAALLTMEAGDPKRVPSVVAAIRRDGMTLLPPDIMKSDPVCRIEEGGIRLGLRCIKGVGKTADLVPSLVREGKIKSIVDLFLHVPGMNLGAAGSLIRAGACDCFGDRATLLAYLPIMIKELSRHKVKVTAFEKKIKSGLLIEVSSSAIKFIPPPMQDAIPFDEMDVVSEEREAMGFSFHPSSIQWVAKGHAYYRSLAHLASYMTDLEDGIEMEIDAVGSKMRFLLEVRTATERRTKKGQAMAKLLLADADGVEIEAVVFPRSFEELGKMPAVGEIVLGEATVQLYAGKLNLQINHIRIMPRTDIMKIRKETVEAWATVGLPVHVWIDREDMTHTTDYLRDVLLSFVGEGSVPIYLHSPLGTEEVFLASDTELAVSALSQRYPGGAVVAAKEAKWNGKKFVVPGEKKKEVKAERNVQAALF